MSLEFETVDGTDLTMCQILTGMADAQRELLQAKVGGQLKLVWEAKEKTSGAGGAFN